VLEADSGGGALELHAQHQVITDLIMPNIGDRSWRSGWQSVIPRPHLAEVLDVISTRALRTCWN